MNHERRDNHHRRSGSHHSSVSSHHNNDETAENTGYTPRQPSGEDRKINVSNSRVQTAYVHIHNALGQTRHLNDNRFSEIRDDLKWCDTHLRKIHHDENPDDARAGYDHTIRIDMDDLIACLDHLHRAVVEFLKVMQHSSQQQLADMGATLARLQHIYDQLVSARNILDSILEPHVHRSSRHDDPHHDPHHDHDENPHHRPKRHHYDEPH